MPNYWLGIMAVALAAALALWIGLVFWADRRPPGPQQESVPEREVIGGSFAARRGGRQVMPDPAEPIAHDDWTTQDQAPVPERAAPAPGTARQETAGPAGQRAEVPQPRSEPVTEQATPPAPARGDRRLPHGPAGHAMMAAWKDSGRAPGWPRHRGAAGAGRTGG